MVGRGRQQSFHFLSFVPISLLFKLFRMYTARKIYRLWSIENTTTPQVLNFGTFQTFTFGSLFMFPALSTLSATKLFLRDFQLF